MRLTMKVRQRRNLCRILFIITKPQHHINMIEVMLRYSNIDKVLFLHSVKGWQDSSLRM